MIDFVADNKSFFEASALSFFEMTTGLAFSYFAKEKVDVAIIETGLGGRLDSTNVIEPLVSVITNIGFDHKQFLGDSLGRIAYEKAGIMKHRVPVVIGETTEETKTVFRTIAKLNSAELHLAENKDFPSYDCDLKGDYQQQNIKTVLTVVSLLQVHYSISKKNIENGLLHVVANTGLLGRWQVLNGKPFVVCDTAHNEHGLKIVINQIKKIKFNQLHVVLGVVNDKDLSEILPLFPKAAIYYFCKPGVSRGLDATVLKEKALEFGLTGNTYNSVSEAYEAALSKAKDNDFVYVGGSTFVVAEII